MDIGRQLLVQGAVVTAAHHMMDGRAPTVCIGGGAEWAEKGISSYMLGTAAALAPCLY